VIERAQRKSNGPAFKAGPSFEALDWDYTRSTRTL